MVPRADGLIRADFISNIVILSINLCRHRAQWYAQENRPPAPSYAPISDAVTPKAAGLSASSSIIPRRPSQTSIWQSLPEEFAYCLARSDGFREFAVQNMTGSSGRQRVPAGSLSQYLLAAPSMEIATHFGALVRPLFARATAAASESRTLAAGPACHRVALHHADRKYRLSDGARNPFIRKCGEV